MELYFLNIAGNERNIPSTYHGSDVQAHLETRLLEETPGESIAGLTVFERQVEAHHYNPNTGSLDIYLKTHEEAFPGLLLLSLCFQ